MKDIRGVEVAVGDTVVTTSYDRSRLRIAEVIKITLKGIKVKDNGLVEQKFKGYFVVIPSKTPDEILGGE